MVSPEDVSKPVSTTRGFSRKHLNPLLSKSSESTRVPQKAKATFSDQIIIKFRDGVHAQQENSLLEKLNATALDTTASGDTQLWQLDGMTAAAAIATYSTLPEVEYIQSNVTVYATDTIPNDPRFDELWGLNNTGQTGGTPDVDIDASTAWNIRTGGDVLVGVIDSGVDYTHPDLRDNIWTNPGEIAGNGIDDDGNGYVDDVHGYDFVNDDGDPLDDDGHGTHVAGTIAAKGNNDIGVVGVNWNAQIAAIKFLDETGFGSTFNAIKAIEYAIAIGADLTNNSWGGGGDEPALRDAIAAAGEQGQLFIASAGNEGTNTDEFPAYPSSYDLDNIISVAATDSNDRLAGFSNFGANTVDLAAPGVEC